MGTKAWTGSTDLQFLIATRPPALQSSHSVLGDDKASFIWKMRVRFSDTSN